LALAPFHKQAIERSFSSKGKEGGVPFADVRTHFSADRWLAITDTCLNLHDLISSKPRDVTDSARWPKKNKSTMDETYEQEKDCPRRHAGGSGKR
jgi:hypothetical protein